MDTMTVDVTPAQAKAFLTKNLKDNRKLRRTYIDYLADCILRGEWKLTHQGIAISSAGELLDGQHRMHAIIKAGVAVPMRVTVDVEPDAFVAMDRGRVRSDGDVLKIDARYVAVARMLAQLPVATNTQLSAPQIGEVLGWAQSPIERAVAVARSNVRGRTNAPTYLACAVRCMTKDADHALNACSGFINLDAPHITPIVSSMLKQVERGEISSVNNRWDFTARVWVMLDPKRVNISKILIKNLDDTLQEMRDAVTTYKIQHKVAP